MLREFGAIRLILVRPGGKIIAGTRECKHRFLFEAHAIILWDFGEARSREVQR
jgi:hypothetical protein